MDSRDRLRSTFDQVALLYDQARPGYPEPLFDDVVSLSGIAPHGRILEIGCGTGQATLPLARRGYWMVCVELGASLADVARQRLLGYPQVTIHHCAFEEWPLPESGFALVVSATAFHWIDPAIAYPKAAQALQPGGAIALFWNLHVGTDADEGFFEAAHEIYRRKAPELARDDHFPLPRPEQVSPWVKEEIEKTGLFGPVTVRRYTWEQSYDATGYIQLLDTYSGHRNLDGKARQQLHAGITQLIETQFSGRVTKGYLTLLYVAHRLPGRG